jgi:two-component system, chemotaxis family, response regulator Rcp1
MAAASEAGRPVEVLLVEDDPDDERLTGGILRDLKGSVQSRLTVARDGNEALDYVHRRGRFASAARPDLVLLELDLLKTPAPAATGHAVLAAIRKSESLSNVPVVVLTRSSDARDIQRAQDLQCSCYITKPGSTGSAGSAGSAGSRTGDERAGLAKVIRFWLDVAATKPPQ